MTDLHGRILDGLVMMILKRTEDPSIEMSADDRIHLAQLRGIIRGDITDRETIEMVFAEADRRLAENEEWAKDIEGRITTLEERHGLPSDGTLDERLERLESLINERRKRWRGRKR